MKPDMRISIKDYRRSKNLKIQLIQLPFSTSRQFWVRMIGFNETAARNPHSHDPAAVS